MGIFQITCLHRDGNDPDRRIDGVGGLWGTITIDELIRHIEEGHDFFVEADGVRAYLEVKVHPISQLKYARTIPDGLYNNNLYALRDCP